ncbi:MAG: hypothetical protein ACRDHE_10765, partial [Ktedonobacterales bacterium]
AALTGLMRALGMSAGASGVEKHPKVTHVASHSLGYIILDRTNPSRELIHNIMRKNDPLPVRVTKRFGIAYANQDSLTFQMLSYTSDQEFVEIDEEIAVTLPLPPGLPANAALDVTFEVNSQGRLNVFARELTSGWSTEAAFETNRTNLPRK